MAKKQNPEDYLTIKDLMQEQLDVLEKQEEKVEKINAVFKDQASNLFGASNYQKKIVEQLNKAKDISAEEKVIQKSIVEIMTTKKYLSAAAKKTILEGLDGRMKELTLQKKQKAEEAEKKKLVDERLKQLEADKAKAIAATKELTDSLAESTDGFIDSIETKVKTIPFLGGFLAKTMGFDKLRDEFKEKVAGEFTKHFKEAMVAEKGLSESMMAGFKGMTGGVKGFGKSLLTALAPFAPLLIILALIKGALDFDKEVTELSRNLGISRDAAEEMNTEFKEMAASDIVVTSKELLSAQTELAEATGMSAQFSEDMLKTQAKLVKFMGMTGAEAANLSVYSESIGMNTRDLQLEVVGVVHQFNEATGASVNLSDVLKDISDLSASIKSHFKGNVEEMAKAVTLARSMGISLSESVTAAETTLSIESSLKNEMTAMMVAGVSINNNAIRRAQLAGEHEEVLRLQKEQLMEMGDLADKSPMQQKAIADAMGFTVDKLMEMNEHAKFQKEMGVDISTATLEEINNSTSLTAEKKKEILQQREQLSIQEKIAGIADKLGKIFLAFEPALSVVVDILSVVADTINLILTPFTAMYDIIKESSLAIGTFLVTLGLIYAIKMKMFTKDKASLAIWIAKNTASVVYTGILTTIESIKSKGLLKTIASMAMNAFISMAKIPFIGPILGAMAAASAVGLGMSLMSKAGDMMSPADGKTQVSTKEGGLFELSPNDDVVAAPGLLGGDTNRGETVGGIDLSGLINEIKGLRSSLVNEIKGLRQDIQAQPIQVTVDGRVVSEISRVQKQQNSVSTTGYGR